MLMDRIALALLIVGGVNWGSVGLFRFDREHRAGGPGDLWNDESARHRLLDLRCRVDYGRLAANNPARKA